MNIIHCISAPAAGGAEIYVKDLALSTVKKGHKVHICFLGHAKELGRDENFEVLFLKELDDNMVSYSFIGNYARKKPWNGILHLRKLTKIFQADILHCHLYYFSVFSLFVSNVKVIYTHHNIVLGVNKYLYKLLDFRISSYVGICQACTDVLRDITNKPVVRVDNAVNQKKLIVKKSYVKSSSESVKILMVGGLIKQKNYQLVIEAASKLSDLDFEIQIAGEGPLKDVLYREVVTNSLQNKVNFIGNCNNIPEMLNQSDIFAMCSEWEGLPISLIEATLSGVPVIVTDVGGCAEVVRHCKNGIVINKLNAIDYAKGLRKLIESIEFRKQCFINALDKCEKFTIGYSVNKHLVLYNNVLM